jgi:hypothetical protein
MLSIPLFLLSNLPLFRATSVFELCVKAGRMLAQNAQHQGTKKSKRQRRAMKNRSRTWAKGATERANEAIDVRVHERILVGWKSRSTQTIRTKAT